ncbi:MAG TPA: hypothetical protein VMR17_25980 [Xanthobacteraceae bacterium]|nr:hypothetical protein [Xanthobacteraceae bacterium]
MNEVSKSGAAKFKVAVSKGKTTATRSRKLKSSLWYEGAARSIGISSKKPPEERNAQRAR